MFSSLLIESAQKYCDSDVTEAEVDAAVDMEVLQILQQLQDSEENKEGVPNFHFRTENIVTDSFAWLMQRCVQRKQADDRMFELAALEHGLQVHGAEQERIKYNEYFQVSVIPLQTGPCCTGPDWLLSLRYMDVLCTDSGRQRHSVLSLQFPHDIHGAIRDIRGCFHPSSV